MADDFRARKRVRIGKTAFARNDAKSYGGVLGDVSASGAYITYNRPLEGNEIGFAKGDPVDILISKMSVLSGWVVRAGPDGVAVEFAHDDEGEKRLIAEIMAENDFNEIG